MYIVLTVALIIFSLIGWIVFKNYQNQAKFNKFISDLILREGYVDITTDPMKNEEVVDKISMLNSIFMPNDFRPRLTKVIMKEEEEKVFYFADINYNQSGRGDMVPGSSPCSIFMGELPRNFGSYIIRQKFYSFIENLIGAVENRGPALPGLEREFEEKFVAYRRGEEPGGHIVTSSLQRYIMNYSGKYPLLKQNSMTWIITGGNFFLISGIRATEEENLRNLIAFGRGFSDCLLKSFEEISYRPIPVSTGRLCSYCGAAVTEGIKFCNECGKEIVSLQP